MGLDDNAEKTAYAWRQLEEADFDSEQYNAAFDHLFSTPLDIDAWIKLMTLDAERCQIDRALEDESREETAHSDPQ